jgi:tetratricopeptide (TPR) repeat protein
MSILPRWKLAKALNKRVPDDVMVYGLLTDANVELGNYKDAEIAAQWMLNLRPGNLPALTRAARLRELFGDAEGAYELMEMAYQSTPPTETGERACILTQMGHLRLASGSTDAAEKLFQQALTSFQAIPPPGKSGPGSHHAEALRGSGSPLAAALSGRATPRISMTWPKRCNWRARCRSEEGIC